MTLYANRVLVAELDAAVGEVGTPSSYAKDIERQERLASGKIFNCYRSKHLPVPLLLLYREFEDFCLRGASTTEIPMRTTLFTLDLCETMRKFTSKEIKREHAFGKLIREFLQGQLSDVLTLTHQVRGESIIDIRLQVQVGASQGGYMHIHWMGP